MLTPFDDFPIHQVPLPIAHPAGGDANHYDRYWFNGIREDLYFGVAMGRYPNRGVLDGAFAVVHDGVQRSVFASGRAPIDPTVTNIGPIAIEVVEPLRVTRVVVDAPDHGLRADITYTARSAAYEEPRQTRSRGTRLWTDVTRMTQWGTWTGTIEVGDDTIDLAERATYATKDRSWGTRPVGQPAPAAPVDDEGQVFFLWAPLHFDDACVHYLVFEEGDGHRWAETAAILSVIGHDGPTWGPAATYTVLAGGDHEISWAAHARRSERAALTLRRRGGEIERIELEPLLTFRMRGLGYGHPQWRHGTWRDELVVGGEQHQVEQLDSADPTCVHVQQVMRATWGERRGLGVLEQLALGRHDPSGFR